MKIVSLEFEAHWSDTKYIDESFPTMTKTKSKIFNSHSHKKDILIDDKLDSFRLKHNITDQYTNDSGRGSTERIDVTAPNPIRLLNVKWDSIDKPKKNANYFEDIQMQYLTKRSNSRSRIVPKSKIISTDFRN